MEYSGFHDILLLLFLISPPLFRHPIRIIVDTPKQDLPMGKSSKVRDMELLIHLIALLEAYDLCACGLFQCSPVQLTHPTQTICFQQTPNQMKSVLQPSTILFTRPFETKETAHTQCTNSAGNATCLLCRHRDHCLFQERLDSSSMKLAV